MSNNNYSRTIQVKNTPEAAYAALTSGFEHWWTKPDAPLLKPGDQAKFSFPPGKSFWKFAATELQPHEKVVMRCVEALHLHEGYPAAIEQEWLDTTVVFDITASEGGSSIRIEHLGLQPKLHCYQICEEGWDFFFLDSLKSYLDTGVGKPHKY